MTSGVAAPVPDAAAHLADAATPPQLPGELFYLYFAAPFLFGPVLQRTFFEMSPGAMALNIAENFLPFLGIPAAIHAVYRWVLPRLRWRPRPLAARMLIHAAIAVAVAVPIALLIRPVLGLAHHRAPPALGFSVACVVITWMLVLPALLVQEMRDRAQAVARRLDEQRQATLRAELEALQSRTQPHFLFNALNTVASLIPSQPQRAEETLERLADMLRYTLKSGRREHVPLRDELTLARDYLEVQHARFGERLRFTLDVPPEHADHSLPPLLIQPLIENAVLHGIARRAAGGTLTLTVATDERGRLTVRVDDRGEGAPEPSAHRGSGTSLDDLRHRLHLLYGDAARLTLTPNDGGGLTAELSLPERTAA